MADDKTKQDARDRNRVAAGQDYEVDYLVEKMGISRALAIGLIQKHGNDRATLERAAKELR